MSLAGYDVQGINIGLTTDTTIDTPLPITSWISDFGNSYVQGQVTTVYVTITRESNGTRDGYFSETVKSANSVTGSVLTYNITTATFRDFRIVRVFQ